MTSIWVMLCGLLTLSVSGCDAPVADRSVSPPVSPAPASGAAEVVPAATAPAAPRATSAFQPVVAGAFYPGDRAELQRLLEGYLAAAPVPAVQGTLLGLMSPHAGYVYSGPAAARGYKLLQGRQVKRVVVMAPSHRAYGEGIGTLPQAAYHTPLGDLPIDRAAVDRLVKAADFIREAPRLFVQEHSLEVQLPFLQTVLPGVPVVPLVHGSPDPDLARRLAAVLDATFPGTDTLFIASSDLSHFHPDAEARALDGATLKHIVALDVDALDRESACGRGPIRTLVELTRRRRGAATQVFYNNSGDTSGDRSRVVGYGVVAFTQR